MVSVIIPAHNEEKVIAKTIESILNQTMKVSQVIVVLDNCTDKTKEISKKYDVEIYETINNTFKKAGALNQVFNNFRLNKYVLVMDADTILDNKVIEEGVKFLENNKDHAAVCSRAGIIKPDFKTFKEKFIWQLQHLEYSFFDAERIETSGSIKVLHGMCTIYRFKALRQIIRERGCVYLNGCLTEDYELTLMLKKNGWKVSTNLKMEAWTDVPLRIKDLWRQRYRWLLGGIESLIMHGFKKYTYKDIMSHFVFIFLTIMQLLLIVISVFFLKELPTINLLIGFILVLSLIDSIYRSKYIQKKTLTDYIYILTVLPVLIYNIFNSMVLMYSYWLYFRRKKVSW